MQELEGSTARQLDQAGQWKYSNPWMSYSVYKGGLAGGGRNTFFSVSSNPLLSRTSNFSRSLVFFGSYAKFVSLAKSAKFMSSRKRVGSATTAQGSAANQWSGSEKTVLCIVCFAHSCLPLLLVVLLAVLIFPLVSY